MSRDRSNRRGTGLLGPTALLIAAMAGCGSEPDRDGAIVLPEPGTTPSTSSSTASSGASADVAAPTGQPKADAGAARVADGFGTLRGRVIFTGSPPEPAIKVPQGQASKDPQVCAADQPIISEHLVINPENQGVQNALVYIPRPTAVSPEALQAAEQAEVIFDQANCVFTPHVLAVLEGSEVTIKSSDPVNHNVNASLGSFRLNQAFSPNDARAVTLDSATRSPGQVVCDVHPWMLAYWMVCDNPYFAVTDENGEFVIEDVPAGTQGVLVWHEATDYLTDRRGDPVDVQADGEVTVEYTIESSAVRPE